MAQEKKRPFLDSKLEQLQVCVQNKSKQEAATYIVLSAVFILI